MPRSMVRLSAGRESMSEATQALCFLAGANSIFTGDKLLTTANAGDDADAALFAKLGLKPLESEEPMRSSSRHPELGSGSIFVKGGAVSEMDAETSSA
jgi:biotin synthase